MLFNTESREEGQLKLWTKAMIKTSVNELLESKV
jgi:hypothetical protein